MRTYPPEAWTRLGSQIRAARKAARPRITQGALAVRAGRSVKTVSTVENGSSIGDDALEDLCVALGWSKGRGIEILEGEPSTLSDDLAMIDLPRTARERIQAAITRIQDELDTLRRDVDDTEPSGRTGGSVGS